MVNGLKIKELIKELKLSVSQFEAEIGVRKSLITKTIQRDNEIKPETKDKILRTFPQINPDWLATGFGNMFIERNSQSGTVKETDAAYMRVVNKEDVKQNKQIKETDTLVADNQYSGTVYDGDRDNLKSEDMPNRIPMYLQQLLADQEKLTAAQLNSTQIQLKLADNQARLIALLEREMAAHYTNDRLKGN